MPLVAVLSYMGRAGTAEFPEIYSPGSLPGLQVPSVDHAGLITPSVQDGAVCFFGRYSDV